MATIVLGRLEKVILRETWPTEAMDFTPWLAQEENLSLLGETLGIELELEAQEKNVGPFRADILCKDTLNGHWVLIENQIERTDHTHLGQLLTYAAGLKAVTIVWVAAEFTDEHRAALDWLNEVTGERINFFGLEIELWRIGNSLAAPKFNVVCRPNNWTEDVSKAKNVLETQAVSETKRLQQEFWKSFSDYLKAHNCQVKPTKALPQHWMYMAIGRSNFTLSAAVNSVENRLTVGLVLGGSDAKPHFRLLQREKQKIEAEFGQTLDWRLLPEKIESHIVLEKHNADPFEKARWTEYHEWMANNLETFNSVFRNRVRKLNAVEYTSDGDSNLSTIGN